MANASDLIGPGLTHFLSWWRNELTGMLPGAMRQEASNGAPRLILSSEDGTLRIVSGKGVAAFGLPSGAKPEKDLLAALARQNRSKPVRGIVLRLPYSACFVRRLELPFAAARNAANILALNLEQSTPFKLDEVVTACYPENSPASPGKIWVRQVIAKRTTADRLHQLVAAAGFKVEAIDCWNETGAEPLPVNFLVAEGGSRGALPGALAILACILGLLSGYVFVSKLESALEEVQASQAPLKARMAQIREAQARAEAVRSEANVTEKLKTYSISPVAVLEELTRLLPDSAYLIDLKISGDTIDIAGLAKNSAALIPVIERSSFFYGAASTAPLTLEPTQEKERFSIRMRVRSAQGQTEKQAEDGQ